MPELPEVEIIKRGLEDLIVGRCIATLTYDWQKAFPNSPADVEKFVIDARITGVKRRAKVLIVELSTNYVLLVHLKMTGQLVFVDKTSRFGAGHPNESLIGRLPDASTRIQILFVDESMLFFNDQRKFGWMKLIPIAALESDSFLKKLGPEPLEDSFTSDVFISRIRKRSNSNIKSVLLDQSILAGVGNIYADESLWGAMIHPSSMVRDLTDNDLQKLHKELVFVLKLSIEKGGSTDKTYVNAEGKKGSYIQFARVFRREGMHCPRCDTVIIKSRVAGRGTHTCPNCQTAKTPGFVKRIKE
jgi:formamidopyrimidine-DNA glycosylase